MKASFLVWPPREGYRVYTLWSPFDDNPPGRTVVHSPFGYMGQEDDFGFSGSVFSV